VKRYRLVREGHDEWGVADRFSGKLVMTQESFAIADQLTDALNGLPGHPYTEIAEIANSIRAKQAA